MAYAILGILLILGGGVAYLLHLANARNRANQRAKEAIAKAKAADEVAEAERRARAVSEATTRKLDEVGDDDRDGLLLRLASYGLLRRRNGDSSKAGPSEPS